MLQSEIVKKYDTYKDSGIEWIGEIPQEWGLTKIGQVYDERNEKVSDKDYQPLSVTKNGVVPQLETAAKTDNGDNRKLVKINDFAINSRSDRRGSCGISEYEGSVSLINTVLSPRKNMCNKYYNYTFKSECFADEFYKWGNGIVDDLWSTKWSAMKNIYIPNPKLEEQQRIAEYLDKKCGDIDRVVETEKAVIEKLKEYKQSIITEAVTKGLDKSTPLKDSGIEWIGKIPQHWETCKLLKLYKERKCKNKGNIETNVLSLSYGNIKKRNVENNMGLLPESFETYNIIVPDNIVLRLTDLQNDHRSLRCGLVKEQGIITSAYVTLEKKLDNISSNYYYRLLHTFDIMKGFYGMGDGVRQNLKYDGELCNLLVVRPPYAEQQQIAEYLDKKCSEIDKAIADKEQVIEKFTEYKKSLIYECVTGKRRVVE